MNDNDLGATLRLIHQDRTRLEDPPALHGRVLSIPSTAPQRRAWLPPFPTGRFQSMFSATKFVVAGVIVAIFGGTLVTGVLRQDAEPPPIAGVSASASAENDSTTSPTTAAVDDPGWPPATLPEGATMGTLETPRGPATWVRLPSDDGGFAPYDNRGRNPSPVIRWPSGYAAFVNVEELWVSADGIDWHTEPLHLPPGARGASLVHADGSYLLMSTDSATRLWRSDDGMTWKQLDGNGVWPPGPIGLRWRAPRDATAAGGRTLVDARFEASLPRERLGLKRNCRALSRVSDRVYKCTGTVRKNEEASIEVRTLRFGKSKNGLRVMNHETGEQLGTIEGADLGTIRELADAHGTRIDRSVVLLIEGDSIERVQAPWGESRWFESRVSLLSAGDSFYAYQLSNDDLGAWTVWRSDDGRTWQDLGASVLDVPADSPPRVRQSQDVLSLAFWSDREDEGLEEVASFAIAGGTTWEAAPTGNPEGTSRKRLDSGWFAADPAGYERDGGGDLWVHVDGEWISLVPLGIEPVKGRCHAEISAVGDMTFIAADGDCLAAGGPGGRWILKLDATG